MRKWLLLLILALSTFASAQTRITQQNVSQYFQQSSSPGTPAVNTAYFYLNSSNQLVCVLPDGSSCLGGGGGTVTSVFTRTGAVVATTGDYTVAQVTGAAPLASPTFTGTVTIPGGASISGFAPLASPTFTGTAITTTAAVDTNTTQIASTAFVLAQAASANPLIDGTAAPGTSTRYARGDHVHPTDTTRAALASPTFTGTPAAPTAAVGTNTTQIASTAFVLANLPNVPTLGKWLCGNHADGAGATWTCVSRSNVTSGDHLIAGCSGFLNDAGAATTTIADTLTNTWTRVGTEYFESSPSTYHITAFRATAGSSGADTITCTSTNAATSFTGSVLLTTLNDSSVDVAPGGNSGTNGSGDSLTLTTTASNDLCFQWGTGSTPLVGGGTTLVYNGQNGVVMSMRNVGPAGTYTLSTQTGANGTSGNFGNISFCLK